MKKMKKFISMLVAATMTLAMAAPSFAAEEVKNGSITIQNATVGKEYTAYRIFAATRGVAETEDADTPISYIATKTQEEWFKNQSGNIFNFTPRNDNDYPYYVTVPQNVSATEVSDFLTGLITKTEGEKTVIDTEADFFDYIIDSESETAKSANCTIEGLGYGYFLVTSGLGTTISLDSTNPNATILDKNQQGPSKDEDDGDGKWIVTVDGSNNEVTDDKISANYGDTVNFKVQFSTTNYEGEKQITEYKIIDTLEDGMTYNMNSIEVMVGDQKLDASKYTVSEVTTVDGKDTFTVTVPWNTEYVSPNKLIVTYSATVDANATITNEGIKNTAQLTYKVDGDETEKNPENLKDEVTTYLYALAIKKTDRNGAPLAGATFSLEDSAGNAITVSGSEGNYSYDANGTATIESPENGTIIVKGLKAGSYTLKETKAPNGYNLLDEEKTIEAVIEAKYKTTYYYTYENGEVTLVNVEEGGVAPEGAVEVDGNGMPLVTPITVINNAGQTLPSTGGIGTTIFYAAGIILMAGAVFFVVRRKRA